MKRVCVIVCNNGLGHIRRVLPVVQAMLDREDHLHVTVACAQSQLAALSRWEVALGLRSHSRAAFQIFDSYPRAWLACGDFRGEELLNWHASLEVLELDRYDLVISDNLVEALIYQPRTVLMGSFLWHDVYGAQFAGEPVVEEYRRRSKALLDEHKPPMIANRYFAMPAVLEQTRAVLVGMLPAAVKHSGDRSRERGLLCIGSSIAPAEELMRRLTRAISPAAARSGIRLYVDQRLARDLAPTNGFALFDHDADDFDSIGAVIARPGLGIITDCVISGIPLFCVHESNVEMEHNARILESLGLGWTPDSPYGCVDRLASLLDDSTAREEYGRRSELLDKGGLEQTVDYLLTYLG